MAENTFNSLIRRVSRAGFSGEFVRQVLLPDWWDPSCEQDAGVVAELEVRVARFFRVGIETVRAPDANLLVPAYPGARLRRVRNVNADKLGAAIHAALQIAGAVVRSLRDADPSVNLPPKDPKGWFDAVKTAHGRFDLDGAVDDLWRRGIPVVHVELLPAPKFQGLACIIENRPVILLGHDNDAPPRLAFHLGHEVGHVVHGDCSPGVPVVDEDEETTDTSEIEKRADDFAWRALGGGQAIPAGPGGTFKDWATSAEQLEARLGIDPGAAVWAWANGAKDFQKGVLALKALYLAQGGRRILRRHFDLHVDLTKASDTDRSLLRCVHLEPDRDGAAP